MSSKKKMHKYNPDYDNNRDIESILQDITLRSNSQMVSNMFSVIANSTIDLTRLIVENRTRNF